MNKVKEALYIDCNTIIYDKKKVMKELIQKGIINGKYLNIKLFKYFLEKIGKTSKVNYFSFLFHIDL
jgi:hypothetical protein